MMLEFEDPDDKYDFKDSKKEKIGLTRIKILGLFLIFFSLVLVLANNNYKLDLLKATVVPVITDCNPLYNFKSSDNKTTMTSNAERVLQDNLHKLEQLEGFERGYVENVPTDEASSKIPEIILEFKNSSKTQKEIPNEMCGFDVSIVDK